MWKENILWGLLIALIITIAVIRRKVVQEIKRNKRREQISERNRYFTLMERYGLGFHQIHDQYKKIKSYEELIRINNDLERTANQYNL